jgi:hypothetical protein
VGFRTAIFNQSGGSITLSNAGASWGAWATSSGSLSIPNGQVAMVSVIQPASAGVVYASISNTGTGGGGGTAGFAPVSGRFYFPPFEATAVRAILANKLYALPKRLRAGTYRGLAITTSAPSTSTSCRAVLYSDNGSASPGAVLAENTLTITVAGIQYADFTGGDYTAAADTNVWTSVICNGPNGMNVTSMAPGAGGTFTDILGGDPSGANSQIGLTSSTITTFPAGTLASTNSGNFGSTSYVNDPAAMPIVYLKAR